MKRVLQVLCILLLCLELFFIEKLRIETPLPTASRITQQAAATPAPEAVPAAAVATAEPEPTASPEPTPEPTPEPQKEFVITCLGDCTLWSNDNYQYHPAGFKGVMGDDYAYPFSNTVQYFTDDELTIANCECIFTDNPNLPYDYTWATFAFRAPTEYAEVFNEGGVDFVTTANNHMMDCYQKGADSTYATLEEHGIPYGKEGEAQIITTEHGLRIGIYCSGTDMAPNKAKAVEAIEQLQADGAEYIICAFHWGREAYYDLTEAMITLAHACVDAGADLIYGSHPHVLNKVEEYGNGLILYSCGNWVFGGNTMPKDPDTAIFRVILERKDDGSLARKELEIIPCCVSSKLEEAEAHAQNYNDYCPTPYETDSEGFNRVYAKLSGEFKPTSQGADYTDYYASRAG